MEGNIFVFIDLFLVDPFNRLFGGFSKNSGAKNINKFDFSRGFHCPLSNRRKRSILTSLRLKFPCPDFRNQRPILGLIPDSHIIHLATNPFYNNMVPINYN